MNVFLCYCSHCVLRILFVKEKRKRIKVRFLDDLCLSLLFNDNLEQIYCGIWERWNPEISKECFTKF